MQLLSERKTPPPPPDIRKRNAVFLGDMDFLVDGTVITAPRECFQSAQDLAFLASVQLHIDAKGRGVQSRHDPIPLQNIHKEAFEAFIKVALARPAHHNVMLAQSQWVDVHRLASMWKIEDVKQTAYGKIESILFFHPVYALRLSNDPTYSLQHWMHPAITSILLRKESLSIEEIEFLGPQLTQKIHKIEHNTLASVARQGILVDPVSGQQIPIDRSTWDFSEEIIHAIGPYRIA